MLRVKISKIEPNSIPLCELNPGSIFKTQYGRTAYMVIEPCEGMKIPMYKIAVVCLDSGRIHLLNYEQPVVELDGTAELYRIKIERR